MIVLAIDPGQEKCGVAVVDGEGVLHQQVVSRQSYLHVLKDLSKRYPVKQIILGDRTGSREFAKEIQGGLPTIPLLTVDEHLTTEEARRRYWQGNRPRGWRRLIPTSMQVPPEPYDDYVAVILAERFLRGGR